MRCSSEMRRCDDDENDVRHARKIAKCDIVFAMIKDTFSQFHSQKPVICESLLKSG